MRRRVNFFMVCCIIFCSNNAFSEWDNGGITASVESVTVLQNGAFYIMADKDICDPGVVNKIAYVYKGKEPNGVAQTIEGINMMLSIALTAQATKVNVKIYADDSGSARGCKMGAIKLYK